MKKFLIILITLLPMIASAQTPPDLWSGNWKDVLHKTYWLFQDGNRVWGENTRGIIFEGRVSPDGRTVRGTWWRKSTHQGLFEWQQSEDGQTYMGDGEHAQVPLGVFPDATINDWGGYRTETDYEQPNAFPAVSPYWGTGIDLDDPVYIDWLNFRGAFPSPTGGAPTMEPAPQPDPQSPLILGEWSVIGPGPSKLGRVFVEQDRETGLMFFEGRAIFDKLEPGDALPLEIAQLDAQTASVQVRIPGEKTVSSVARFIEMEGDQFRFELSRGDLVWQDFTFMVVANAKIDRLPTRGGPSATGEYRLTNLSPGQVVEVRSLPHRGSNIKYLMSKDVAGFKVLHCRGFAPEDWKFLSGEALTERIFDTFCNVSFDGGSGWIGGSLITR